MFFKKRKPEQQKKTKMQLLRFYLAKALFITVGAFIFAAGLEMFLLPNKIIDGGVVGISMMISYITKWNLGLLIFCINIPFVLMALKNLGKNFVIQTFFATAMLGIATNILHGRQATEDLLLATVFGGIIIGFGVGIILRNNASLDGTEMVSINLARKLKIISVGELLMFINLFIYMGAAFLFGWDRALYSILTYYIASKVIDSVLEGLDKAKSVRIFSEYYKEIGEAIMKELNVSVTYMKGLGGYSKQEKVQTYCVVSKFETAKLKELVHSIDPRAFWVTEDVYEVEGVRVKKRKH